MHFRKTPVRYNPREMEEEKKGWTPIQSVAAAAVVLVVTFFLIWILGIPLEEVGPLLCTAQLLSILFYIIYQNLKD